MTELKFEKDKHYRTRSDRKALCVHVWPDGSALFIDGGEHWRTNTTGRYLATGKTLLDIVDEWREPRQWDVYIVEYSDGEVEGTMNPGNRKVLAKRRLTEGEGLE